MKAHDGASFNIYVCTMSCRIVFDRLDHISMYEATEAQPLKWNELEDFYPPVFGVWRFKLAHCIDERLIPKKKVCMIFSSYK